MTMSEGILLAHDIGSSGTKSSLVDPSGRVGASFSTGHATQCPRPGQAQQNPLDWWEGVCSNTRKLAQAHPDLAERICGIGVSGHMLGLVPVDAKGKPVRPAMIHSDLRAGAEMQEVAASIGPREMYELTGNLLDPRSVPCKMLHMSRHEPQRYEATRTFLQAKDYIVGCMTGDFSGTDYSDASHAQWIDIRKRTLATELFKELSLDASKLPRLRKATDVVGPLRPEAASQMGLKPGAPVVAGGGDGACASAGAGAVKPGDTYGCLGTTAWISATTDEPVIDPKGRLFNILSLDNRNGVYGTVQSAGRSLQWALELIGQTDFQHFDSLVEQAEPGCGGLIFLPYLEGERSPIFDANARGVYFGISPEHGRAEFLRAAVEGVSFALRSVLEVLRETREIPALRLIGGGGRSLAWQRLLAEICNVRIDLLSTRAPEATSLGAALAAGCGVGLFDSLAEGAAAIEVTSHIDPPPKANGACERNYKMYQDLYPDLKDAFARHNAAMNGETSS